MNGISYDVRIWAIETYRGAKDYHVHSPVEGRPQAVETVIPHHRAGGQLPR